MISALVLGASSDSDEEQGVAPEELDEIDSIGEAELDEVNGVDD